MSAAPGVVTTNRGKPVSFASALEGAVFADACRMVDLIADPATRALAVSRLKTAALPHARRFMLTQPGAPTPAATPQAIADAVDGALSLVDAMRRT